MQPNSGTGADVPSPCVGICQLDAAGRYCTGCYRTLGEIAEWGTAGSERKRAILARIASELPRAETTSKP